MKISLQNKYKNKNPEETINIIQDFFEKKNCKINKKEFIKNEIGTYSCYYELIFNNKILYGSSGKGTTKAYAEASCYAELYERFCAFPILCHNVINYANLKNNGKKTNIDELLNNFIAKESLQTVIPTLDKKLLEEYFNIKYGNEFYTYKYCNINNPKDIIWFNGILSTYYYGTTGLAAGNTLEEALIQGTSELYEREVHEKFCTQKQNKYFYLNEDILPTYLKELINNIKALNYDIKIYDLSYNFKLPVCAIILINKKEHKIFTHFGAFPVIEIAIERCLTEFYQGIQTINNRERKKLITEKEVIPEILINSSSNGDYYDEAIPDNLLLNSQKTDSYNDLIFLSNKVYTDKDLINQINKINKINNLELYYLDLSLTQKIFVVHIIPNKNFGFCVYKAIDIIEKLYNENPQKYISALHVSNIILRGLKTVCINKKIPTEQELINYLNKIIFLIPTNSSEERYEFLNMVSDNLKHEYINPYKVKNDSNAYYNQFLMNCLIGNFIDININQNTEFFENIIPWIYFYLYCIKNNNNIEKYNKIIYKLGYSPINITKENFTPASFINEAIVKNFQSIYNSSEYFEFINLFTKEENLNEE